MVVVKGMGRRGGHSPIPTGQREFRSPGNQHHQERFIRKVELASDRKNFKSLRVSSTVLFYSRLTLR